MNQQKSIYETLAAFGHEMLHNYVESSAAITKTELESDAKTITGTELKQVMKELIEASKSSKKLVPATVKKILVDTKIIESSALSAFFKELGLQEKDPADLEPTNNKSSEQSK